VVRVALGRYAAIPGRHPQMSEDSYVFGSDALWVPEHNTLSVADSWHHYHLYPISERDVQAAFDIVRTGLAEQDPAEPMGTEFLEGLLQMIHRGFVEIDLRSHIAGIEFEPVSIPGLPEPAEDSEAEPLVHIVLLQLQGCHLSIASVGNFLVYVVRPAGCVLAYGVDWYSGERVGVSQTAWSWRVAGRLDVPEVRSVEVELEPGGLLIVATPSLAEVIALAEFAQFAQKMGCGPKAASAHLMTTLKSVVPKGAIDFGKPHEATKHLVGMYGAAWAMACVEDQKGRTVMAE
jgi:hypothetical protein